MPRLKKKTTKKTYPDRDGAEFVTHSNCDHCGSSDALAIYSDGGTFCFSCRHFTRGDGTEGIEPLEEKVSGLVEYGSPLGWTSRKLTSATCRKWGITVTEYNGKEVRAFNYRDSKGSLVAQKIRTSDKKFKFLGDAKKAGLFGQHLWRGKGRMIVVTEGEIDAASLSQVQGHKWPVVSVPNGASGARKSLEKAYDWLSGYDYVILMFDNDEPGIAAAQECATLFRPGQCKISSLPLKDANEMLQEGREEELINALWESKEYRPDGIILGSELLETISKPQPMSGTMYPWTKMNEMTKGFRLGELITFTSGSGLGKSTIMREIAYHLLIEGKNLGMLMFEENVRRTSLGLIGLHLNKPIIYEEDPSSVKGFMEAYEATVGTGRVCFYDHFGSTAIENVLERIRYMKHAYGAEYIFLDHLSILVSGMADGDERRLIDNAMTELKSLAMELNIVLFLVSHLRRPQGDRGHEDGAQTSLGQLRGSHAIAQLSDLVVGFERDQQDEKFKHITTLRILKNRWTGLTGEAGFLEYIQDTGRMKETKNGPKRDKRKRRSSYDGAEEFDPGGELY